MKSRVIWTLFSALFIATLLPLSASYIVMNDTLTRSLNLGFSEDVGNLIERYQNRLKELRRLEPNRSEELRSEFEDTRELMAVFRQSGEVRSVLSRTLLTYLSVGLVFIAIVSALIAGYLGRRLSRIYSDAFQEIQTQKDRVRYLEEIAQWQEIAKSLAHEIKNPLTPIELLVSGLENEHSRADEATFRVRLQETRKIVSEEVEHLRRLVQDFSGFASLPSARVELQSLEQFVRDFVEAYGSTWNSIQFSIETKGSTNHYRTNIDAGLFRQVFMNLINNAVEANAHRGIQMTFRLDHTEDRLFLWIENDGKTIEENVRQKMFLPYFSTKKGGSNMGLGLTIVKKIISEHSGNIRVEERNSGAAFQIDLPRQGYSA